MPRAKGGKPAAKPAAAPDPRAALNGRFLGVPTDFFNVLTDGQRYLATCKGPHKDRKEMVWMKFAQAGYGEEAFAPLSLVRKWLISDEEAEDGEWYEDPEDQSDLDSDDDESGGGGGGAPAAAPNQRRRRQPHQPGEPRGSVKGGRWQPAKAPKTPHAVDSIKWRKATGRVPSHKPKVFARKLPAGVNEGLQQPLPRKGPINLELFNRQWNMDCWRLVSKYSKKRVKDLNIGAATAKTKKPNMKQRSDGTKGRQRKAPDMSIPNLIRFHVIVTAMALCRLPARKYYWRKGRFIGVEGISVIMGENQFSQMARCLYDCDASKLIARGDLKSPPPVGYDKMAKTSELDTLVMNNTLATMCPPKQLSDDEASHPEWHGKNGEGACIAWNKDKPAQWATRVQCFNGLDGSRYVWTVLNKPRRESAEHGETHLTTLGLCRQVHAKYGEGFDMGQDSLYNSPVTVVDGATEFKWNMYGTVGWNRRGIELEPDMPSDTRGSCVSYYATVAGVPLTYTLMRDNQVVRFLSSLHGVPTEADGQKKPRWNKAEREFEEVYMPPVKIKYDKGKVGTDLFGQYMAVLESTFKTYHPWMLHHFWLWHGCYVNVHCWRNRLIDEGELRLHGQKKQTLVEDTLQTLEEQLKYADQIEREQSARSKRKRDEPTRSSPRKKVVVSRLGSPTRHFHVTFTKSGECMWCRREITTGCGHPDCGHMHDGNCWKKAHSNDPKIRAKLKRKRVQPEVKPQETKRVKKRRRRVVFEEDE